MQNHLFNFFFFGVGVCAKVAKLYVARMLYMGMSLPPPPSCKNHQDYVLVGGNTSTQPSPGRPFIYGRP